MAASSDSKPAVPRWVSWGLKGAVAIAASVGALAWSVHGVDLGEVMSQLEGSDFVFLGVLVIASVAGHLVRVARWALLIRPLGTVSYRAIFAAASVGFPATFFLPFRLGEFVRPVMISRAGVPFASAMASVVVERVADGLVNLGLFFVLLTMLPANAPVPEELRTFSMIALGLFGGALIFLVVACLAKRPALKLVELILSPLSTGLAQKVRGLLETFIDGVLVLRTPARIFSFFGLSFVFWLFFGGMTWLLARTYIPGINLLAGPFTMSVVVFAIMIPAGPAFAGTLEAGFKLGLAPFLVAAPQALVIALAYHAVQLVQMAILAGLGFLAAEGNQAAGLANNTSDLDRSSGEA